MVICYRISAFGVKNKEQFWAVN